MTDSIARKVALIAANGLVLFVAMAIFEFQMAPPGSSRVGGCIAMLAVLAAVLSAAIAIPAVLIPRTVKGAQFARGAADAALLIASVLVAVNAIPLILLSMNGHL